MDTENKYGTLEIQQKLLELLKEFHSFCITNDIKYSLAYGSLLGAVRHKGFIPWDDDLDIMVDRKNYSKIVETIDTSPTMSIERNRSSLWIDRLRLKNAHYEGPYSPTCDIFLIDCIPDNALLANIKLLAIKMMQGMMKEKLVLNKGNLLVKSCSLMTYVMGLVFSTKTKRSWYNSISQLFNKEGQEKRCYYAAYEDLHCVFPANVLSKVHLTTFEDTDVYIIDEYDSFLKSRYGDYMMPPPNVEQKPKHF